MLWRLNRVAPLIADPPPANSTTMHSRIGFKVRLSYLNQPGYFLWSGKTALTFEIMHSVKKLDIWAGFVENVLIKSFIQPMFKKY